MNRCVACGSSTLLLAFTKEPFDIVRCETCGLGRTAMPGDFNPSTYYSRQYLKAACRTATPTISRPNGRFVWVPSHARVDPATTPARGGLLEFGCAYGFFLQEARAHFADVHGVDVSADAAAFCRSAVSTSSPGSSTTVAGRAVTTLSSASTSSSMCPSRRRRCACSRRGCLPEG